MSDPVIIQLKSEGLDCWHKVDVLPAKRPLLAKLQAGMPVDVKELGRILASGWGTPPKDSEAQDHDA